jgi:hypothetical protein
MVLRILIPFVSGLLFGIYLGLLWAKAIVERFFYR